MIYWRLFNLLDTDRPMGMALGHIPTGSVIQYLKQVRRENDAAEIDRAIHMVRAIDDEYLTSRRTSDTPPAA